MTSEKTIELTSGGFVTLSADVNWFTLSRDDRDYLCELLSELERYQASQRPNPVHLPPPTVRRKSAAAGPPVAATAPDQSARKANRKAPPPSRESGRERVLTVLEELTRDGSWVQPDAVAKRSGLRTSAAAEQLRYLGEAGRADFTKIERGETKYHPRAKYKYRSARPPEIVRPTPVTPEDHLAEASRRLGRPATIPELHKEAGLEGTYLPTRKLVEELTARGDWTRTPGGLDNPGANLYSVATAA